MNMKLQHVATERDGDQYILVFTRHFAHPIGLVWTALTDPQWVVKWAPYEPNRNLASLGPVTLTMADGMSDTPMQEMVTAVEPPNLLEFGWGPGKLRWQLAAVGTGTTLNLRHTVGSADWIAKGAAGWHICLDVADRLLNGEDAKRIVGMDAMNHGWNELHEAYAQELGVTPTPLPEEMTRDRNS